MRPQILVAVALVAGSTAARAESPLVAVPPFAGPADAARACHAAVIDAVQIGQRVVALERINQAAALSDSDATDPQIASRLAELTGADGFIIGRVAETESGFALTLLARELDGDEPPSAMIVSFESDEPSAGDKERILKFALGAIRPDDDLGEEDGEDDDGDGEATEPLAPSWMAVSAAVGLGASARRLSFRAEPGLPGTPSLAGNPSAGVRLEAEAATRETPGIALGGSYQRTVGARITSSEGFQLPIAQSQWNVAARGRLRFRGLELEPSVGYGEVGYRLQVRPAGVLVPDASYGYLEVGADARYASGPAAVFAGGRYLHPVTIRGITDPMTFGDASARGLEVTGGFAFRASERLWIRVTGRYTRFALAFDGTGLMTMGLDDDPEMDVFGAIDAFAGGDAAVVFTL